MSAIINLIGPSFRYDYMHDQEMSNLELVHKLRTDKDNISIGEGNEIVLILLERLVLRDIINNPDPYLSKP